MTEQEVHFRRTRHLIEPFVEAVIAEGYTPFRPDAAYVEEDGNLGVVGFTAAGTRRFGEVSVHLGVQSRRLSDLFGPTLGPRFPELGVDHWTRGGVYISPDDAPQTGWSIEEHDPNLQVAAMADLHRRVLPALRSRLSDEGLRDDWMRYPDLSLPPIVQQVYLAALLKAIGPSDALPAVEQRLDEMLREKGWDTPGLQGVREGLRRSGITLRLLADT